MLLDACPRFMCFYDVLPFFLFTAFDVTTCVCTCSAVEWPDRRALVSFPRLPSSLPDVDDAAGAEEADQQRD